MFDPDKFLRGLPFLSKFMPKGEPSIGAIDLGDGMYSIPISDTEGKWVSVPPGNVFFKNTSCSNPWYDGVVSGGMPDDVWNAQGITVTFDEVGDMINLKNSNGDAFTIKGNTLTGTLSNCCAPFIDDED